MGRKITVSVVNFINVLFQMLSNEDILQLLKISPESRLFKKMVTFVCFRLKGSLLNSLPYSPNF